MGATKELKGIGGPFLVVDIGGGSTEFVFGSEKVESAKSVNIGCVRMSERHLKKQPPEARTVAVAIEDIDAAIADAARSVPLKKATTLIAVAGTATTVAAAVLELKEYDRYSIHLSRIPAQKVFGLAQQLSLITREEIAALGYMHPGRVDVITSGALILSRVLIATGATEFVASESDILDGIAWGLTTVIEPLPEVIEDDSEEQEEIIEGIDEGAEDVFDEMTQNL
jgi:exopolyphosphatase/guanosine-5'-triphosphate,3'-diphosphate pyrophosphatase